MTENNNIIENGIERFARECMLCLTDDGMLDPAELDRLRNLADELNLSEADLTETQALLTERLIGSLKKRGVNSTKAGKIATRMLAQLLKI
ncbi:hypothetical protein JW935_20540 [candidate division KSB1 bacterium]|nr:hypothetical protein [candidate division KSB1 bacterium]